MLTSQRRRTESIALSLIAVLAVIPLRYFVESQVLLVAEFTSLCTCFLAAEIARRFRGNRSKPIRTSATCFLAITPIAFAILARALGQPIAFEMSGLSTLAAISLSLATGATNDRTRSMSLVAGGFLILFATSISDSPRAVLLALLWMTGCVWHLIANHWEKLDLCMPDTVRSSVGVRPVSVLAAVAVCIAGGLVVHGRVSDSNRFAFGFMPTSGGSEWSDPAARSGVGTGDAAIAAKDHAESFGAVESDIFLESTEPSLFDMFNDMIGEPKKRNKSERAQAMGNENVIPSHQRAATSEQGGSSFSTDRMPPKKHMHFRDKIEKAVIQWDGPAGIRLAMDRYDTFDGLEWTNSSDHRNESLTRKEIDGAAWYADPSMGTLAASTTEVNLLKVLRLDSTRLPVPMMTSALHIKDVDRSDFFGIEDDGSYFMPGREKVPPLTVVNVASWKMMEDELWSGLKSDSRQGLPRREEPKFTRPLGESDSHEGQRFEDHRLEAYATEWTAGCQHPYQKLQAIVANLRTDFIYDRNAETSGNDPVSTFLLTRRGGDHLFATAAALLAREIGLQSRLVTGFYVRPSAVEIAAGHTNVLPEDVHVWVEIQLDDGRWFEIETTPGFRQPIYKPSAWLVATQFAAARWPHALSLFAIAGLLFVTRLFWIELGLSVLFPMGSILWPRGRTVLAMQVLQTRAKWAGCPRTVGRPQRDWLLSLTATNAALREAATRFCDAADQSAFSELSTSLHDPSSSKDLLMHLKIKTLRQLTTEALA